MAKRKQFNCAISDATRKRLDAIASRLPGLSVSLATVMREAIERGLSSLEAEFPAKHAKP